MRIWSFLIAAALLQAIPVSASAQPTVTPGSRVRVIRTLGSEVMQVGVLEQITPDSVVVRDARNSRSVWPMSADYRLDVSMGRHRRVLRGVLIGGASGALGGALIGVAADQDADRRHQSTCMTNDSGECLWGDRWFDGLEIGFGAGIGTGVGILVGGIIGAVPHERWRAVTLPLHSTVSLSPSGRGLTLSIPLGRRQR